VITATFNINPQSPIKFGMTRMRVQVQETSSTNPLDPCQRFAYGGTKDFNVSISDSKPSNRCDSGPTTVFDGNLGPIYLKGDTNTIDDKTGCPGKTGPIDETDLWADITPGENYEITYTVQTCGSVYDSLTTAWIDFNGNSLLEDWERIVPYSTTFGVNTVSFRTPVSSPNQIVVSGSVWMRVQMQETNAVSISPCTFFAYGGTKDFTIRLAGLYCGSGPTATGGISLGPIQLQGASTKIDDSTACPGGIGPQLFLNQSADLVQGQPWVISYNVINCGNSGTYASASWIDFDQDGIFENWEQITPESNTPANLWQFKVPPSTPDQQVKTGTTRLRVQVQTGVTGPLNPCNTNFIYGGTKDFTVKIITS